MNNHPWLSSSHLWGRICKQEYCSFLPSVQSETPHIECRAPDLPGDTGCQLKTGPPHCDQMGPSWARMKRWPCPHGPQAGTRSPELLCLSHLVRPLGLGRQSLQEIRMSLRLFCIIYTCQGQEHWTLVQALHCSLWCTVREVEEKWRRTESWAWRYCRRGVWSVLT